MIIETIKFVNSITASWSSWVYDNLIWNNVKEVCYCWWFLEFWYFRTPTFFSSSVQFIIVLYSAVYSGNQKSSDKLRSDVECLLLHSLTSCLKFIYFLLFRYLCRVEIVPNIRGLHFFFSCPPNTYIHQPSPPF